jgi:hypothetical protein
MSMTQHSMVFRAGLVLLMGWAAGAGAQNDLEVTMRVLDDVSDVDAVIVAIGNGDAEAVATPGQSRAGADGVEAAAADRAMPAAEPHAADDLAPENEDESEGGIEDRDVVEEPAAEPPAA